MGIKEGDYLPPAELSDSLKCLVCFEILEDPVFFAGRPCQHVFCRSCVEPRLQQSESESGLCPICGEEVCLENLIPHQALLGLVNEMVVRCGKSCGWTGRRDALASHAEVCPVGRLEAARAELERFSEAQRQLREADEQIAALEKRVVDRDEEVVEISRRLVAREVRISELQARLRNQALLLAEKDAELADHGIAPSLPSSPYPAAAAAAAAAGSWRGSPSPVGSSGRGSSSSPPPPSPFRQRDLPQQPPEHLEHGCTGGADLWL